MREGGKGRCSSTRPGLVSSISFSHTHNTPHSINHHRWYLCKEAPFGKELSFSEKSLAIMHNDELCDKLGNLVHRVTNLTGKYCGGCVPSREGDATKPFDVAALKISVAKLMEEYRLKDIGQQAIDAVAAVNVYLTEEAPWKIKGDGEVRRWV